MSSPNTIQSEEMSVVKKRTDLDDPVLGDLLFRVRDLERKLVGLRDQYCSLREQNHKRCSESLNDALASFHQLIKFVCKTDNTLVYWYERSDGMKSALRLLGMDKRTCTLVAKKTAKIKKEVGKVEVRFRDTSEVFMDGLKAVQILNTQVTSYSVSSIGDVQGDASEALNGYDTQMSWVQSTIGEKNLEATALETQLSTVRTDITKTENARRNTDTARTTATVGAVGGGLAALGFGILAVTCPPIGIPAGIAGIAAGSAGSFGIGSTAAAISFHIHSDRLKTREGELQDQLASVQEQIKTLELDMPLLKSKREDFKIALAYLDALKGRCAGLQQEAQEILRELLQARKMLGNIKFKLEKVASDLMACEYAKTRRNIASRLEDILNNVTSRKSFQYDGPRMLGIQKGLRGIESRTSQVLLILDS